MKISGTPKILMTFLSKIFLDREWLCAVENNHYILVLVFWPRIIIMHACILLQHRLLSGRWFKQKWLKCRQTCHPSIHGAIIKWGNPNREVKREFSH